MKKLMLVFIIGMMLLVPTVLSLSDPTFQFGKGFDLKRSCSDRGFFCDSVFDCNITLVYPDGTLLKDNELMTDSTSYRNITISELENNQLGIVSAIQSCNNGTVGGLENFNVVITADGKEFQIFPQEFTIIIIAFLLISCGLLIERLRLFKHIGGMLLMVMGVITLFPGYSFINYTTLLGKALGFSLVGIGFYFLIEDSFSRDDQDNSFEGGRFDEE